MNIIELKNKVDEVVHRYKRIGYSDKELEEMEVLIPNGKSSIGYTSATEVKSAFEGIDWDNGRFFIYPAVPMKEEVEK